MIANVAGANHGVHFFKFMEFIAITFINSQDSLQMLTILVLQNCKPKCFERMGDMIFVSLDHDKRLHLITSGEFCSLEIIP